MLVFSDSHMKERMRTAHKLITQARPRKRHENPIPKGDLRIWFLRTHQKVGDQLKFFIKTKLEDTYSGIFDKYLGKKRGRKRKRQEGNNFNVTFHFGIP